VFFDHTDPICFLSLVTHLRALIGLLIPYIHIGLSLWLVDLLSTVVMSVEQVFPSYMILSLACVFVRVFGLPSLVM
jgi:phosphoglycerol transferase MdoB-like AlkP superfamily enzyme